MKLLKNNLLPIFHEENSINKDNYITATYNIKTHTNKGDLLRACYELAVGQSIGNPYYRSNHENDNLINVHSCKILHKPEEIENRYSANVKIAFPKINIDFENDGISQLLCMLMGGQMDIETFSGCRLINIDFPSSFEDLFQRPYFGISKTRKLRNSYNKPLFGGIIKPKTGINKFELLDMTKELIDGGVDFIKEDEILSNPHFCTIKDRVPFITNYLEKKNEKIIYAFCINGDHDQVLERAKFIHAEGGNGIHINWWSGIGVYKAVRKLNLPIFIHFQKSGDKSITSQFNPFGIEWSVICKLAAISGVDSIHVGMIGGYLNEDELLIKKIVNDMKKYNVIPTLSCGLNSDSIAKLNSIIGTDYMANVGGAIHSHAKGSMHGALKIRNVIDEENL